MMNERLRTLRRLFMQTLNLSERLTHIAAYLPKGAVFADIGSDHAYLPCHVCKNDRDAFAIAGEVNEGPYLHAKETVQSYHLTHQIDVRLGDGLHILNPNEVKQIVMSGMGGKLMCDILLEGMDKLGKTDRIIVQPNIGENILRKVLSEHHYELSAEELIEENGHVYEIIIADKSNHVQPYSKKELLFGPFLSRERTPLFYKKWKHEYRKRQKIVEQMKKAAIKDEDKMNRYLLELAWIEEVLNHD